MPYIYVNQPWIYMCSPSRSPLPPPSPSDPSGSSQCTSPEHLFHASNLGWWFVSPLIVYLFQCCSLRSSHPRLLPQSPKVCSVNLCLFFCFAYSVIVTIFLKSLYMHEYTVLVFIFLACAVFNTAPSAPDSLAVASVYLLVAGKLTFTWEFFFFFPWFQRKSRVFFHWLFLK